MDLGIIRAFKDGLSGLDWMREGKLTLIVAFTSILTGVFSDSLMLKLNKEAASGGLYDLSALYSAYPMAIDIPVTMSLPFFLTSSILGAIAGVGLIRTYLYGREKPFNRRLFTEGVIRPSLNIIAGNIFFLLAVAIGWVLFIVPGVFVFISLFFWFFYTVDRDLSFYSAMISAWKDSRGQRIRISGLLISVFVFLGMFGTLGSVVFGFIGRSIAGRTGGAFLQAFPSAVMTVLATSIFTECYKMLVVEGSD